MKKIESYEKIFDSVKKNEIIKDYTENYFSIKEISKKYEIKSTYWIRKLLGSKIRTFSEAGKIAHSKYPDSFKLSKEAKNKIRKARLKWMKEHPEKTAWRLKNMSYPEKCFKNLLESNGIDKKYLIYREYPVFPYFIDFAFINEKVAIEIDGSQHLEENRKNKDSKKDKLLISKGWKILRITAIEVMHNGTYALSKLLEMLGNPSIKYEKVGILKTPKTKEKAIRGKDGLTVKQRISALNQRKVEWPPKEKLLEMVATMPFTAIAKKYGVSDKAVANWCKKYGLPYRKKDIYQLVDKKRNYSKESHFCLRCGKEYYTCNHNSKFCCNECYKMYIKDNGLLNKKDRKKSFNWIHIINNDNSITTKRVGGDDLEKYLINGWIKGRC